MTVLNCLLTDEAVYLLTDTLIHVLHRAYQAVDRHVLDALPGRSREEFMTSLASDVRTLERAASSGTGPGR